MDETYDIQFAAAIVDWHVASFAVVFPVSEELGHEVLEGESALLKDACLSILGEYYIVG